LSIPQESNGNVRIVIAGMQNARIMENGNPLTGNCGTSLVATAPEVYRAIAYDSAVDMWALGVLLYEFMSGLFPFRGKGRMLREEIARAAVVFDDFYPGSPQSRDLILSLIQSDPRARLSISGALQHEWFRTEPIDNDLGLAQAMLSH
jgi:serine/threonine protein kinase